MNEVFADTYYFLALLIPQDDAHVASLNASQALSVPIITTEWILLELTDALSDPSRRVMCADFIDDLKRNEAFKVIPATTKAFNAAFSLYRARPDKDWSLTDCISFVVMKERGIAEALTGDHHFEQAGFTVLLKT